MSLMPLSNPLCNQVGALLRSLTELSVELGRGPEAFNRQASGQQIAQLQPTFQALLKGLSEADWEDTAAVGRLRPYQTEAHRRLRLLSVEAMKLQAAKQPETLAKVRSQLQAHLVQLTKFIQAISDEICA